MRTLRTARLLIRDIHPVDAAHLVRLNADEEVLRYVHDSPFSDEKVAREWIEAISTELPNGIGRWSLTLHDGSWIGRCSLRRQPSGDVLMGYRLLRVHWGRGYATEAVGALLDLAFNTHRLPCIHSIIAKDNIASRRVAEKNGGYLWGSGKGTSGVEEVVYRFQRSSTIGP